MTRFCFGSVALGVCSSTRTQFGAIQSTLRDVPFNTLLLTLMTTQGFEPSFTMESILNFDTDQIVRANESSYLQL